MALTRWSFVGKVMSLIFNVLSRLVIAFLLRSKRLNFMAAVTICSDFGAPKNKVSRFPLFPHLFAMKCWDQKPWSSFFKCWILSQLFHSSLPLSPRGFSNAQVESKQKFPPSNNTYPSAGKCICKHWCKHCDSGKSRGWIAIVGTCVCSVSVLQDSSQPHGL